MIAFDRPTDRRLLLDLGADEELVAWLDDGELALLARGVRAVMTLARADARQRVVDKRVAATGRVGWRPWSAAERTFMTARAEMAGARHVARFGLMALSLRQTRSGALAA